MKPEVERAIAVLRAIVHEVRVERVTFMAGSLAYNAFVSLLPLVLLLLAVVSAVGDQRLETALLGVTNAVVTPGAGEVLVREVRNASTEVSVLGAGFLVWGALRIFRSLDAAFSDVYETAAENTFADQLLDGAVVFVTVSALVMVVVALETLVPSDLGATGGWLPQRLVLVVGVAITLVPMYYIFPDESDMKLVEVLPGVAVTAGGLVVFQSLFKLYIQYSRTAERESILASILVFMTWLYFSGLIVLVGAAVNAVLANRSADVSLPPVVGGAPVDEAAADAEGEPERVETVERLGDALLGASDVEVVVDGESIRLATPDQATVDVDTAVVPFVDDHVDLELRWPVADDE